MAKPTLRAFIHASELITGKGIRKKNGRRIQEGDLGAIPDGAVVFEVSRKQKKEIPGKIKWVGPTQKLPKRFSRIKKTDLKNQKAVIPGLIDCHTHLVFGGNRADEFAQRCGGVSYEEIAAKGGGILSTIRPTREASETELYQTAVKRLKEAISYGVRTIEIKSGYGLNFEAEIKTLRVIQKLKKAFPEIEIQATFLGAHAFPPDFSREEYIREIVDRMIPFVGEKKLAECCDVFIDRGYFTLEEGKEILTAAKKFGLKVKIHADELVDTGSAGLAVDLNALSADHLLCVNDKNIQKLADSETVAVLLPGTAFYLKADYAPARKLIETGVAVAISTDFNPGSSVVNSLPAIMTLSALYMGMTRAEIFAAVTFNAAKALGMEKKIGTIETGKKALLTVLPFSRFEALYYQFGWSSRFHPCG